ncbi:MAG: hypothetical protein AAB966_00015 [Patescibacteria group bacterium]
MEYDEEEFYNNTTEADFKESSVIESENALKIKAQQDDLKEERENKVDVLSEQLSFLISECEKVGIPVFLNHSRTDILFEWIKLKAN